MTLEAIALWAQRKGIDLLGTGDCLQGDWLREIETKLVPAEPGFFTLAPDVESAIAKKLPEKLRHSLRYVLSTEVCCAPPSTPELGGIHHLLYFPSLDGVHRFREKIARYGHLHEGRPTLALTSRQLLELVLLHGDDCHLAPAHVFNPWFSTLGTVGGRLSLQEVFGDLTPHLLAVETGLTSTPPMCRRVSGLDPFALFSCSDAHSLGNLGREYTLLDIEPNYPSLFSALRSGSPKHVLGTKKFPLHHTRHFLNWCGPCGKKADAHKCPSCGRPLVTGSRDRLEKVADRTAPKISADSPPFQELLPLAHVLAQLHRRKPDSAVIAPLATRIIDAVGHERFILTEATEDEINRAGFPQIARALLAQRHAPTAFFAEAPASSLSPIPEQIFLSLS